MYQGRQVASAQAMDERSGAGTPAKTAKPAPQAAGRRHRIALPPVLESARTAREFTASTLRGWHLDLLVEDAVVIASELATNAIRHGTPAGAGVNVELSWCCQASRLICVVTDQTGTPPALAPEDPEAESGHGLQIVAALAVAWGWTVLGTGEKAVWAALELPGAPGVSGPAAATPAAVRDMRVAGRAADQGRRGPSPAARLCPAAGWPRRCGAGAASARS
jgi:anti-sigma regulatory factor (Ser/Thr protein kinase)